MPARKLMPAAVRALLDVMEHTVGAAAPARGARRAGKVEGKADVKADSKA